MPRATGRVDKPDFFEPKLGDSWLQRAVEDELLDEFRGLQQGITFTRLLRQILVEVAQEARIPAFVGEVVYQLAGLRHPTPPEVDQLLGRIAGDAIHPDGVVRFV